MYVPDITSLPPPLRCTSSATDCWLRVPRSDRSVTTTCTKRGHTPVVDRDHAALELHQKFHRNFGTFVQRTCYPVAEISLCKLLEDEWESCRAGPTFITLRGGAAIRPHHLMQSMLSPFLCFRLRDRRNILPRAKRRHGCEAHQLHAYKSVVGLRTNLGLSPLWWLQQACAPLQGTLKTPRPWHAKRLGRPKFGLGQVSIAMSSFSRRRDVQPMPQEIHQKTHAWNPTA